MGPTKEKAGIRERLPPVRLISMKSGTTNSLHLSRRIRVFRNDFPCWINTSSLRRKHAYRLVIELTSKPDDLFPHPNRCGINKRLSRPFGHPDMRRVSEKSRSHLWMLLACHPAPDPSTSSG